MERNEAAAKGLSTYNTGRPCVHGHDPIRYTANGICVACAKKNNKKTRVVWSESLALQARDLARLSVRVHRDDLDAITAYINAANVMRGLELVGEPERFVGLTDAQARQAVGRKDWPTISAQLQRERVEAAARQVPFLPPETRIDL